MVKRVHTFFSFNQSFQSLPLTGSRRLFYLGLLLFAPVWVWSQCMNPTINLPDNSFPVDGSTGNAYCTTLSFDPLMTGFPFGLSMDLTHTYEGDLSIMVVACGNTLNVMQRPGTDNCNGGCDCGSSADVNGTVIFQDGGGPDPDFGIGPSGGTFGVTTNDPCNVGSPGITSFASLWGSCGPGLIQAEICITDHAGADQGTAANVSFLFPNPVVCGCTNPLAVNYDPTATVDDGSCIDQCDNYMVQAQPGQTACATETTILGVNVTGGSGAYDYMWSVTPPTGLAFLSGINSPSPTFGPFPPGFFGTYTFSVQVTDLTFGCVDAASFTVDIVEAEPVTITGNTFVCQDGSTLLTAQGGPFNTYTWNVYGTPAPGGPSITVPAPPGGPGASGVVSLTTTDGNGCSSMADITVFTQPEPFVEIIPTPLCLGGTAVLTASPPIYVGYEWEYGGIPIGNTPTVTISQPGQYMVTVTDPTGCTGTAMVDVFFTPAQPVLFSGDLFACPGQEATITVEDPFNLGYQAYQWSNGETTQSITVDMGGDYDVTTVDAQGCISEGTYTITNIPNPEPTIEGDTVFCAGDTVSLTVPGTFQDVIWSTGSDTSTIEVSSSGVYTVSVTDNSGCVGTASVMATETPLPDVGIDGVLGFCGDTLTTLTGTPDGLSTYEWSTGETTQSIEVDSTGTFVLVGTDENGCQNDATVTTEVFALPMPEITGLLSYCVGQSTDLTVGPGYATVLWSTGDTSEGITVTSPGAYSVTVTTADGCVGSVSVDVVELQSLQPGIMGDEFFCAGTSTTLTGEAGFSTYSWSTGSTAEMISVDTPGDVTLSVTDANGCTGSTTITIDELALPVPGITGQDYFCTGTETELSAVETTFQSYQWSTGSDSTSTPVSVAGTVTLTVIDEFACEGSNTFDVTESALPTPQIVGDLQFCPESNTQLSTAIPYASYDWSTGSNSPDIIVSDETLIELTVVDDEGCIGSTSATTSYFATAIPTIEGDLEYCPGTSTVLTAVGNFTGYSWSNGDMDMTSTVTSPDNYSVTVTDANGCQTEANTDVAEFVVVAPQIDGPQVMCAGDQITLTAEAGYTNHQWNGTPGTADLPVTAGGQYDLSVLDANGCATGNAVFVVENALPEVTIGGSLTFCTGFSTTLDVGAGYTAYSWSDGSDAQTLEVSVPGNISVTVTDSNNCMNDAAVMVDEDTELSPVITGALEYCAGSSTTLDAGQGFAVYSWSGGSGEQTLEVNAPGVYTVMVEDANGCMGDTLVTVVENALPTPTLDAPVGFCADQNAMISVVETYNSYAWSTGADLSSITTTEGGTFTVAVTDGNGCIDSVSTSLDVYALPEPSISTLGYFCENDAATLMVPDTFATYNWSAGGDVNEISVSVPGVVVLNVTDANGCAASTSAPVEEIALPVADAGPDLSLNCITTEIEIGAAENTALSYAWSGPGISGATMSQPNPQVDSAGVYQLVVTDITYGCVSFPAEMQLIDLAYEPVVVIDVDGLIDCDTETVTLSGEGSTTGPDVSYQWALDDEMIAGAVGLTIEAETGGRYELFVHDIATGCAGEEAAVVEEDFNYPNAHAGPAALLNCDITSVVLDASLSDAQSGIEYQWTSSAPNAILQGANTQAPLVQAPGVYTISVLNTTNGCESSADVIVTQDVEAPTAIAGDAQELNCVIESVDMDGSASSGTGPLSYSWSIEGVPNFASAEASFPTSIGGTYILTVRNESNGCTDTDEVTVFVDEAQPTAINLLLDNPTCFGDEDGSLIIAGVEGGTTPMLYSVNGAPFTSEAILRDIGAGDYVVTIEDAQGCQLTVDTFIADGFDLDLNLGDDQFIVYGDEVDLLAQRNIDEQYVAEFYWDANEWLPCLDCPYTGTFAPLSTATYSATLVDVNGCTRTDRVTIFVDKPREVYIPNVFSPNGDGLNDAFYVFSPGGVERIKTFAVYNRWGEPVYEVNDIQPNDPIVGWNGKYRGQQMNSAVFVYVVEVEFIDGEVVLFEGDVTLVNK